MNPYSFSFYHCPFCRNEDGRIQANIDVAQRQEGHEIDLNVDPDQRVILFGPARQSTPCDHVLNLQFEVGIEANTGPEDTLLTLYYNHPCILGGPASDMLLENFGWVLDSDDKVPYFDPGSPYKIQDVEICHTLNENRHSYSRAVIRLSGWVVVAAEPQLFIDELRLMEELSSHALAYRNKLRDKSDEQVAVIQQ